MGMISRKGFFFSDFGDRLIMSAVVNELVFGLCGKPTAEVLISWGQIFSAFSAQVG